MRARWLVMSSILPFAYDPCISCVLISGKVKRAGWFGQDPNVHRSLWLTQAGFCAVEPEALQPMVRTFGTADEPPGYGANSPGRRPRAFPCTARYTGSEQPGNGEIGAPSDVNHGHYQSSVVEMVRRSIRMTQHAPAGSSGSVQRCSTPGDHIQAMPMDYSCAARACSGGQRSSA